MMTQTDVYQKCTQWYKSLSGQETLEKLDDLCTDIMSEIFGYYAIETGVLSHQHEFLQHSRITAGFSLTIMEGVDIQENNCPNNPSLFSTIEQLPISTDNIDLVVASHVLELSRNPHQVLREIDRVLVPEGHCILIGFNPFSIAQTGVRLKAGFKGKDNIYKMRSVHRIRDWFSLLGFEVLDVNYLAYRPKVNNKKIYESLKWLERLGKYTGPLLGNIYLVHAKKQVIAMRPDKKVWKAPAVLKGGKVALNRTARKIRQDNYSNS